MIKLLLAVVLVAVEPAINYEARIWWSDGKIEISYSTTKEDCLNIKPMVNSGKWKVVQREGLTVTAVECRRIPTCFPTLNDCRP